MNMEYTKKWKLEQTRLYGGWAQEHEMPDTTGELTTYWVWHWISCSTEYQSSDKFYNKEDCEFCNKNDCLEDNE